MAIPVILKGETPKPIPLALKEGYNYSGCCLHVEFCGLQDTFINLEAGGRVDLRYTAEQTAVLPLGTSKVMLSLENANGEVRFMPWAKIKVTDSPADLYDGVITIDPATLDVDDLTAGDSLGTVKSRLNAVMAFLRGLKVLAVCALPFFALADVEPQYATMNDIPGDASIMTNTEAYVEAKMGLIPAPDFSTNNAALVETIEATAPAPGDYANVSNKAVNAVQTEADPNVPAWAKKTVGDFYSYNLYSLVNRDFYAKDSSIKSQNTIWLKGDSKPTVTVGRDKISDNTFPYSRQTVLGFSAYEGFDYYAHYRPRGIYIWPWWNEDAEDSIAYLFPTNGNGGTFALTSDIPDVPAWALEAQKPTYTAAEVGATTPADVTAAIREQSLGGIWDAELEVWWTPRMKNGSLTYEATTNVNLNAGN